MIADDAQGDALARADGRPDAPAASSNTTTCCLNLNPPCALADTSWIQARQGRLGLVVGQLREGRELQAGHEHRHDEALHRLRRRHQLEYMLVDAGWCPVGRGRAARKTS